LLVNAGGSAKTLTLWLEDGPAAHIAVVSA
jgi:hypothetical protein